MAAQPSDVLAMLTEFFAAEQIEATARRTGFVRRTSKITGKLFLALVTFGGWSDATTTLAQLAAKATQVGRQVAVSPEALYQRMNKRALAFSAGNDPHRLGEAPILQAVLRCQPLCVLCPGAHCG